MLIFDRTFDGTTNVTMQNCSTGRYLAMVNGTLVALSEHELPVADEQLWRVEPQQTPNGACPASHTIRNTTSNEVLSHGRKGPVHTVLAARNEENTRWKIVPGPGDGGLFYVSDAQEELYLKDAAGGAATGSVSVTVLGADGVGQDHSLQWRLCAGHVRAWNITPVDQLPDPGARTAIEFLIGECSYADLIRGDKNKLTRVATFTLGDCGKAFDDKKKADKVKKYLGKKEEGHYRIDRQKGTGTVYANIQGQVGPFSVFNVLVRTGLGTIEQGVLKRGMKQSLTSQQKVWIDEGGLHDQDPPRRG
jgi:hypothetical protein